MTGVLEPPVRERPEASARWRAVRPRLPHPRLPRGLWICMALAFTNALVWAFLTPTFQGPDEPVHVGYAQYVAETGKLPRSLTPYYAPSADANAALNRISFTILGHPDWSSADGRR